MDKKSIKKLDKVWSERIKIKAGYKCEVCGTTRALNSCHIIGRRYRSTRWGCWMTDEKGKKYYDLCGFSGCVACHMKYDEHAPLEIYIRKKVIGELRHEKIAAIAHQSIAKDQNYEEIMEAILSVK